MLRVFGAMATCETSDSGLERTPSDRTFVLLAAAITGVVASNLFAPQILVGPIGSSLGMTEQQAGIISSITFLGYASGLFLLVPLTDILENKRLILFTLISNIIAAFTTAARRGRHARAGASSSGWQYFGPGIASPARPRNAIPVAQKCEQHGGKHRVAILAAFALLNAQHHAFGVRYRTPLARRPRRRAVPPRRRH